MKKIFALVAAFAFLLLPLSFTACGGDSPADADGKKVNGEGSLHVGECDYSENYCSWEKNAFILQSDEGGYQVLLKGIQVTSIRIDGDYFSERSGDTLHVWDDVERIDVITLDCPVEAKFDISAADADIKYFKFHSDVYKILPIDSNYENSSCHVDTSALEKSSSSGQDVESSSSVGEVPSSSQDVEPSSSDGDVEQSSSSVPPEQSSSSVPPQQSSSSVPPEQSSSSVPPQQSSSSVPPEQSSSSVPPQQSSSSVLPGDYTPRDSIKMSFKHCYESPYNRPAPLNKPALLKEATEDLPLAYLYHEGDKYQLMIPKIRDYCGFEKVMMDVGRSGDTLKLDIVAMIATACLCTSDHWFDIEERDADIKFFALKLYQKKLQVYEVVPGPAPEE